MKEIVVVAVGEKGVNDLRNRNGEVRSAMCEEAKVEGPEIMVTHSGGDHFSIRVRGHVVEVDQPSEMGGDDKAPTPTELFVSSLAACVAFYARRFLRRHQLPDTVRVRVQWGMARHPARVDQLLLDVEAPSVPIARREQFMRVIEHCTVHNTLVKPPEVQIRLNMQVTPTIDVAS